MTTIDLAIVNPSQPSPTGEMGGPAMPSYPSLSLQGEPAMQAGADLQPGDEFTAEVTFRVVTNEEGQLDLEAVSMSKEDAAPPEGEEMGGGEALDAFLASKGGAPMAMPA